jgi:hypothetical protein
VRSRGAVAAGGAVVLVAALIGVGVTIRYRDEQARRHETALRESRDIAEALATAVARGDGQCVCEWRRPSDTVPSGRVIASTPDWDTDPWGKPWMAQCCGAEVRVWSTGPDQTRDTVDDVLATQKVRL